MDIKTTKSTTIYRVMCSDNYQRTEPETSWHTSKEWCENYITKSYYKHCLRIESTELIIDD